MSRLDSGDIVLIADEGYFSAPYDWGRTEYLHGFHYEYPDIEKWRKIRKITLGGDIFGELETGSLSMLDAFRTLLSRDYPPLGNALRRIFDDLCRAEKPEGILTWCNIPSLELAAAEYGLPVIHNEFGPFRPPNYTGTIYFDFKGVNGNTSAARDMSAFMDEVRHDETFRPLDMEELRQLFMVDPARALQRPPMLFKSGVALQVEDDSNMLAFNRGMNNFELIFAARKGLLPGELLIRRHPKGYLEYGSSLGVLDNSADSIEFISRCERVFCTNSSVAFEAMLMEKPVKLFGDSPIACLSHEKYRELSPRERLLCLNYMFIGYLVPVSLLFDRDYYRWRLEFPTFREIYDRHLDYFRRCGADASTNDLNTRAEKPAEKYVHGFSNPNDVLWFGMHLYQESRHAESREWFEAARRWPDVHPDIAAEACFHLAEIFRVQGDEERWRQYSLEGIRVLEAWRSEDVRRPLKIGMRFYLLGEWLRSRPFFQTVADSPDVDAEKRTEANLMLARIHYQLGEMAPWASLLARIIEEKGISYPQPWELFELSRWHYGRGDREQSRRGFEHLIESNLVTESRLVEAYVCLADIYSREGCQDKRECLLRSGIEIMEAIDPKSNSMALLLAGWFLELGDRAGSLHWLEYIHNLLYENYWSDHDAYQIASLFKRTGKHESAVAWFQRVLNTAESESVRAGAFFHLGELALRQKDSSRARDYLKKCLELNPQHRKAQVFYTQILNGAVPVPDP
ncbi:MAG: tetratricopeptide repeat protein [Acidobacteria bacterium]|nr:tetratricopeptide repeat protein [Acidobacteriota bacterium]